jgi:hypothetical protein
MTPRIQDIYKTLYYADYDDVEIDDQMELDFEPEDNLR